jgi:predicted nucleotidyltransferase
MSPGAAEISRRVIPTLRRRGVVRASIFGSVARGEERPESDVDFLVEFEPGRTLFDLAGLCLDLEEELGRPVDVVTRGGLHPKLKDRILEEQIEIL